MSKSKAFSTLVLLLVPVILVALGVGGYFAYQRIDAQHKRNEKELERFGYEMVASSTSFETTGELGAKQLPPTFDENKLTPTQKVIKSLINDKEQLITETQVLKSEIEKLQAQINELEDYKRLNEHFAPERLEDELKSVERQLKAFLIRSPDAERFTTLQIEIMAAAGAAEYKAYITRNRLMLSEDKKQTLISDYLPGYAFCVGDAVEVAANSASEERRLATFFRTDDTSDLPQALYQDLSMVLEPCQLSVRQRLEEDKL
ncbi:hypothetical protein [Neptunomonas sp. XY-337]|uniref:hypothetical protein n=1 Tax=Neptunomonas sp. XY-337 TaxID=2561897 RepID=UPI0010AAEED7|nr:hypothetical protein [Neptunomonas sp. XY-337]